MPFCKASKKHVEQEFSCLQCMSIYIHVCKQQSFFPPDCVSEHDAFRSMWSLLQSSINPQDISGILYEKKLISKSEREEIDNVRNTRHNRITALLECVERMIRIDKETFWIFLEVLKPEYNKLAMQLQTQVRKGTQLVNVFSVLTICTSHHHHIDYNNSCTTMPVFILITLLCKHAILFYLSHS